MTEPNRHLRRRVYEILETPTRGDRLSWVVEIALICLICANVLAVVFETVESLQVAYGGWFAAFDTFCVIIFTVEYALRIWASAEHAPRIPPWRARLRYARSPIAVIDLAAILPFYLALLLPMELQALRVLRLLRVFKLTRYSPALSILLSVIREEAATLIAAFSILAIMIVFAATGVYYAERAAQPEAFGSVPAAMWWALVTLTTVGYGDVTPVTAQGRLLGGAITILGVGMAALPAGILASGLADQMHQRRDDLKARFRQALQDGHIDLKEGRKIEQLRRELGIKRRVARGIYDELRAKPPTSATCTCPECGHRFLRETEPS